MDAQYYIAGESKVHLQKKKNIKRRMSVSHLQIPLTEQKLTKLHDFQSYHIYLHVILSKT